MTTYELWDRASRNLIGWFEERELALEAVRSYLDADEADQVVLIVRDEDGSAVQSSTGTALADWAIGLSAAS